MNCWHCGTELIWGGDHDIDEEDENYLIVSNLSCPQCGSIVDVYYPKEPGQPSDRQPFKLNTPDKDEWAMECRWIGHNEEIPEGFELANERISHHSRHSRLVIKEYP